MDKSEQTQQLLLGASVTNMAVGLEALGEARRQLTLACRYTGLRYEDRARMDAVAAQLERLIHDVNVELRPLAASVKTPIEVGA